MAEKKIDGDTFRVEKLPPLQAHRLLVRLGKTFGPALGELEGVFAETDERQRDRAAMKVLGEFFMSIDENDSSQLLEDLCSSAAVQEEGGGYSQVIFSVHLHSLATAYKLAYFVVETQFRDFFSDVQAAGAQLAGMVSRRSSPKVKSMQ